MPRKPLDFALVREIALALPGVEAHATARSFSLKLNGKLLACPAVNKSAEPNSLVLMVGLDARARLIADDPDKYYVTDHYLGNPVVLVRLSRMDRPAMRSVLELAWQRGSTSPSARKSPARRKLRAIRRKTPK